MCFNKNLDLPSFVEFFKQTLKIAKLKIYWKPIEKPNLPTKKQPPSLARPKPSQQPWAKYKPNDNDVAVHVEMDEENEEKPNNYSVEDTPGMTPREQGCFFHDNFSKGQN